MAIPNYLGSRRGMRPLMDNLGGDGTIGAGDPFDASNGSLPFDPNDPTGGMDPGADDPSSPDYPYPPVPGLGGPVGIQLGPNPLPGTPGPTGPTLTVNRPPTPAPGSPGESPRPGSSRVPPDYQGLPSWSVTGTGQMPPGNSTPPPSQPPPDQPPPQPPAAPNYPTVPPGGLQTWGAPQRPSRPATGPTFGQNLPPAWPPTGGPTLGQTTGTSGTGTSTSTGSTDTQNPAPTRTGPTPPSSPAPSSSSSGTVGVAPALNSPYIAGIPGGLNYNFQPIQDNPSAPMSTPNYAGMANYGFNPQAQNRGQGQQQQQQGVPNYNGGNISQGLNAAGVNTPNWLRAVMGIGGL